MKTLFQSTLILLSAMFMSVASAAGDAAAGAKKTVTCMACHGQNGISIADLAIHAYKSGARNEPLMKPMVAPLTDADIENIAAYYSTLNCK